MFAERQATCPDYSFLLFAQSAPFVFFGVAWLLDIFVFRQFGLRHWLRLLAQDSRAAAGHQGTSATNSYVAPLSNHLLPRPDRPSCMPMLMCNSMPQAQRQAAMAIPLGTMTSAGGRPTASEATGAGPVLSLGDETFTLTAMPPTPAKRTPSTSAGKWKTGYLKRRACASHQHAKWR